MTKYIDKDKAHMYCADSMLAGEITKEQEDLIDDFLEGCSTVDIVHCKDCKRYVSDGGALMVCDIEGNPTDEDDYCSYGERKEKCNGEG